MENDQLAALNRCSPRCTAKSKRSGQQCRNPAVAGSSKCRMHGGKSLSGISHPCYRHGLYSKALPRDLRKRYRTALEDPELLSLEKDVALLSVRASELLGQLGQEEQPPWSRAVESLNDVALALQRGDPAEVGEALAAHGKVVREGAAAARNYELTWRELREVITDKTRVSRAEHQRLEALQATITSAQALAFVTALLEAVRQHVADRPTLQRVQDTFNRLLGSGDTINGAVNGQAKLPA